MSGSRSDDLPRTRPPVSPESGNRATARLLALVTETEAEARLSRFAGDKGRAILADHLAGIRRRLELRLEAEEEGREPDRDTLELFS